MREVDERPNRLINVLIALSFLVYFFVAAIPLKKELALHPVWARDISKDASSASPLSTEHSLVFNFGGRYGSVSSDGIVELSRETSFDAAISDKAIIPYTRESSALEVLKPDGASLSRIQGEGWPFFRSGRLFLASPEMNSVSEYTLDGKLLWSYDYPFTITEFDAASSLTIAGLLDGTLECVDSKGLSVLSFAPGGSRIEVVLGAALDPNEEAIAAVCGADRQRFILLVKKGDTFKVQYHKYLDSDYREPVSVRFTQDGRYILYRQPDGIMIFDRSNGTESLLPIRAQSFEVASDPVRGLQFIFATLNRSRAIICIQPPTRIIFSYTLPGGPFWSHFTDDSLYLGLGHVLGRMDISEE